MRSVRCPTECGSTVRRGRQNGIFYLDGDVEEVVAIIRDAYSPGAVPLLSPVAPVERDVFTYRLEWQMLTWVRLDFTHEAYLLGRQSLSDGNFAQHPDGPTLATHEFLVDINTYPSVASIIMVAEPVLSGFSVMSLFILRHYAGITAV